MKSFIHVRETQTEDLTSPGTIKTTVSVGTAKVEVVYTIKEAPAEKPVVTPTAKPTDKPVATPTAETDQDLGFSGDEEVC